MPNRIIKESIWTSPNLNQLNKLAELHFYRLLPLPDDHGCCQVTPAVVKGRCYPLREDITITMIEQWNEELERLDLIRTWNENGRQYAWFPKWKDHQRIRSLHNRKTPEPPQSVICRQVSSSDALNPNPNHNLNPKSPSESGLGESENRPKKKTRTHIRLEVFCEEYAKIYNRDYIVGNYKEEGGAAKRTVSKIPDDEIYRLAVRAYLASKEEKLTQNGHSFLWFIRELNRWVSKAREKAHDSADEKYTHLYES